MYYLYGASWYKPNKKKDMPSEFTAIVSLEPFYQRFLRKHFNQPECEPFVFPARHDFSTWFAFAVNIRPENVSLEYYGENQFEVSLRNMEHKDPYSYNYISPHRQKVFRRMVHEYWQMRFHEAMTKIYLKCRYNQIELIDDLKEEFGFIASDTDRLLKEIQRYYKREQLRRFRKKRKEKRMSRA